MLTPAEAWALRRALMGKDWKEAQGAISRVVDTLAGNAAQHRDVNQLSAFFGADLMAEIFHANPDGPCPGAPQGDDFNVPDLPAYARLSTSQEKLAGEAGQWERDFTAWAGRTANETPLSFHRIAGLAIAGVAIGRRLYVATHYGEDVHPNLYVMIVAISTYYHKTTSLRLAERLLRRAMPYMHLPEPGSPENLLLQISGAESLLDGMREQDKDKYRRGITHFAAQRLIIRDEMSGLFKAMGKDYMAGMKERLMQLYDAPDELLMSSNSKGIVVIKDAALSILGTTTPASLASAVTGVDWRDGNMARFCLVTPEPDYTDRPPSDGREACADLEAVILRLHTSLPEPVPASEGDGRKSERWALEVKAYKHFQTYTKALRSMTSEKANLDDRLRGFYGRHPTKTLKIATILAGLDWATEGCKARPVISEAHWFRAQQIAEELRASAHRCLKEMTTSAFNEAEVKVRYILGRFPQGISRADLYRRSDLPAKALDDVMGALIEAGEVEEKATPTRGRMAKVYQWAKESD
jgi:hypothetical protein